MCKKSKTIFRYVMMFSFSYTIMFYEYKSKSYCD